MGPRSDEIYGNFKNLRASWCTQEAPESLELSHNGRVPSPTVCSAVGATAATCPGATAAAVSTASGNDFPDADLAPLTLLGGTSARAQMAAADTAFVMAIHGATLVSIPRVLAVVDPTTIGYVDGDPSSRPALAPASNVSVGSGDASWCPGLLFCK